MPNYFVVYECPGGVCTWRGSAETPDQFIYSLKELSVFGKPEDHYPESDKGS